MDDPKELKTPSYRRHRASGQAVVTLSDRDFYLGPYGTRASHREYDRITGEWLQNGRRIPEPKASITVTELLAGFWRHVESYYVKNGKPTTEQQAFRVALKPLRELYGRTPAEDFGPLALKAVRERFVKRDLSRSYINKLVARIKLAFKWGVENELVDESIYRALATVSGLHKGRSGVREAPPVRPVPDAFVDAVKNHVSPQVWSMIELQRHTGMRPGEVVIMRGCDIDTTGELWEYRPGTHKTEHHDRERIIPLGPKAKEVVEGVLKPNTSAYLFSPQAAEASRHAKAKTHRRENQKPNRRKTGRRLGARYTVYSYRRAIARGCELAFPLPAPLAMKADEDEEKWTKRLTAEQKEQVRGWRDEHTWHPHQLRHSYATKLRKRYGIEAARVALGHTSPAVTALYAEMDRAKAGAIAAEIG